MKAYCILSNGLFYVPKQFSEDSQVIFVIKIVKLVVEFESLCEHDEI